MDLTSWLMLLAGGAGVLILAAWSARRAGRYAAERAYKAEERRQAEARSMAEGEHTRLITDWGDKIIAAGKHYDKIMEVGPPPDGAMRYYEKINAQRYHVGATPYEIYRKVCEWPHRRLELLGAYESGSAFKAADVLREIAEGTFPSMPRIEFIFGEGADHRFLEKRYDEKFVELVGLIETADPAEARRLFKKLRKKIDELSARSPFESLFKALYPDYRGKLRVNLPPGWNDLVARFIRTPELNDFSFSVRELSEAEVLRIATQAVKGHSLTKAKLALAYAAVEQRHGGGRHHHSLIRLPYREMMGDELTGQLARLVEELHEEQGLFVSDKSSK